MAVTLDARTVKIVPSGDGKLYGSYPDGDGPSAVSWPVNWPNVAGGYNISGSLANPGNLVNDPWRTRMAKRDLVVYQGLFDGAGNRTAYYNALSWMATNYPNGRRLFIHNPGEVKKVSPWNGGQARQKAALDTLGGFPNDWILQDASGNYKSASFNPTDLWKCNEASHLVPTNSAGDTYAEAYAKEYKSWTDGSTPTLTSVLDGCYHDVASLMPQKTYAADGVTRDDTRDYNLDASNDSITDNSTGATDNDDGGAVMHRKGILAFITAMKAQYGSGFAYAGNGGRDGIVYTDSGIGPLPLTSSEFYKAWDFRVNEFAHRPAGFDDSLGEYTHSGAGAALATFYRRHLITRTVIKDDADNPFGRSFVLADWEGITRTVDTDMAWIEEDWAFFRAGWALCLLESRLMFSPHSGKQWPVFLDESVIDLGNPVGTPSMGSLNLATSEFTLRAADNNGFYWQEYDNALVLFNGNVPDAGVWPQTATDTVTLPDPGTGKVWKRFDADTYTNSTTGFATVAQDTTTNDGRTEGATLNLRRFHGLCLLRADA